MKNLTLASVLLAGVSIGAQAHQISDMTETALCTIFSLPGGGAWGLPNKDNPLNSLDDVSLITDKAYLVTAMWSYKFPPASGQIMQWYWDTATTYDPNCANLPVIRNLRSKQ